MTSSQSTIESLIELSTGSLKPAKSIHDSKIADFFSYYALNCILVMHIQNADLQVIYIYILQCTRAIHLFSLSVPFTVKLKLIFNRFLCDQGSNTDVTSHH